MTKRNNALDFFKGICILIVVLCHSLSFEYLPDFIASYFGAIFLHGFFCVTGYLYYIKKDKENIAKNLKKRFVGLIIPYVSFSLIAIIYHIILVFGFECRYISDTYFGKDLILRDIFAAFSGNGIGTLWFLPVLFFATALLMLTVKLISKISVYKIRLLILVLFSIGLLFLSVFSRELSASLNHEGLLYDIIQKYIFMLHRILYGYAYAIIGYILGAIVNKTNKYILIAVAAAILSCVCYILKQSVFFGIFSVICTFLFINKLFEGDNKEKIVKICAPLIYCGKNSLDIMIYHYIFLLPAEIMILNNITGYTGLPGLAQDLILFTINLFTTLIFVYISEKNKYLRIILGKEKYKKLSKEIKQ